MGKCCGYRGDGFWAKVSRLLIPDNPLGVNISRACDCHDRGWSDEANKKADLQLFEDILDSFFSHVGSKTEWPEWRKTLFFFIGGYSVAIIYYIGARIGGIPSKIKRKLSEEG